MKSYSFAKVSARGQLTKADYNNKYIITDDLIQIINLSETAYIDHTKFCSDTKIIVRNMPLTEEGVDMGYDKILDAVKHLLFWDKGQGQHRLSECRHYLLMLQAHNQQKHPQVQFLQGMIGLCHRKTY